MGMGATMRKDGVGTSILLVNLARDFKMTAVGRYRMKLPHIFIPVSKIVMEACKQDTPCRRQDHCVHSFLSPNRPFVVAVDRVPLLHAACQFRVYDSAGARAACVSCVRSYIGHAALLISPNSSCETGRIFV